MSRNAFRTVAAAAALLAAPLAAQQPAGQAAATTVQVEGGLQLETEEQKTLYALGLALSSNLTRLDLTATELAYLVAGMEDGVLERTPRVSLEEYGTKVQELAQARFTAAAERDAAEGRKFLEEQAAAPGAVKMENGIVMFTLQEGAGASPVATDVVRVHYTGTFPTGETFDSSVDRGEPVEFGLDQVIQCWTEALQKMKVGGKARIVCPSDLAYGPGGRPGIPPNATLVFEVELLGIGASAPAPEPASPQGAAPQGEPQVQTAEPQG